MRDIWKTTFKQTFNRSFKRYSAADSYFCIPIFFQSFSWKYIPIVHHYLRVMKSFLVHIVCIDMTMKWNLWSAKLIKCNWNWFVEISAKVIIHIWKRLVHRIRIHRRISCIICEKLFWYHGPSVDDSYPFHSLSFM